MIQVKKITYAPSDIYAMFGTPQNVLPAPDAGYVHNILGITHEMTFNTLAYSGASSFHYGVEDLQNIPVFTEDRVLAEENNYAQPSLKPDANATPFSTTKDFYVTVDFEATTGDSDIIAYIIYEKKLLDV